MATQAEGAHVRQIALAAAFGDRNDVIGVPYRFAAAFFEIPVLQEFAARREIQFAHVAPQGDGVNTALRADTFVPFENFFA